MICPALLLLVAFLINFGHSFKKTIKLIEGIDSNSPSDSFHSADLEDTADPDSLCGPEDLYFLSGSCFSKSIGRFDYSICPFQNITQRRSIGQRSHTLIGVWGSWAPQANISIDSNGYHNEEFTTMRYVDGKSCGDGRHRYSATMTLRCNYEGDRFEVIEIEEDESNTCLINVIFGVPLPCSLFKSRI